MANTDQRNTTKIFIDAWKNKGDEKSETQRFWIGLLRNVLGIENAENYICFEKRVQLDHVSFIDAYIPEIKVLIEQKSFDINLRKPQKQSDGTELTPFQQAKRYADNLPNSERPRYIVVCNFASFLIYDMEHPRNEPEEVLLVNLSKELHRLSFLISQTNIHLKREM